MFVPNNENPDPIQERVGLGLFTDREEELANLMQWVGWLGNLGAVGPWSLIVVMARQPLWNGSIIAYSGNAMMSCLFILNCTRTNYGSMTWSRTIYAHSCGNSWLIEPRCDAGL